MATERMIVWEGPSQLTGKPIVVLATGVPSVGGKARSGNTKTGDMIQLAIMDATVNPTLGLKIGADANVCGGCPFMSKAAGGDGSCYTHKNLRRGFAQNGTWKAHERSGSVPMDLTRFAGQLVRFGSYGDPAAVPVQVWKDIAAVAKGFTGYTHQWREASPEYATVCMASVEDQESHDHATKLGYRTFWVRDPHSPKPKGLITCPASAEAGYKLTCSECLMCSGTQSSQPRSITIERH